MTVTLLPPSTTTPTLKVTPTPEVFELDAGPLVFPPELYPELLEDEVIFKANLVEIFGKRPWDKEEEVKVVEDAEVIAETETTESVTETTNDINSDNETNSEDTKTDTTVSAE